MNGQEIQSTLPPAYSARRGYSSAMPPGLIVIGPEHFERALGKIGHHLAAPRRAAPLSERVV